MYSYPYLNTYNQQNTYNRIDDQIAQLQQMKEQIKNSSVPQTNQQQPSINQTFQLAPNGNGGIRFVNSIDEVSKETVFVETPFFSKDLSVVWIKKPSNDIKAYELNEIVEKDDKDIQIEFLMSQINELKGMIKNNERFISNVNEAEITEDTSKCNESLGESTKKNKSTSISRVSKGTRE